MKAEYLDGAGAAQAWKVFSLVSRVREYLVSILTMELQLRKALVKTFSMLTPSSLIRMLGFQNKSQDTKPIQIKGQQLVIRRSMDSIARAMTPRVANIKPATAMIRPDLEWITCSCTGLVSHISSRLQRQVHVER
jgi:hypothetical protein